MVKLNDVRKLHAQLCNLPWHILFSENFVIEVSISDTCDLQGRAMQVAIHSKSVIFQ